MKRKEFLNITTAAVAACLVNATPLRAFGNDNDKQTLVLLHLKGGNDGLNTVIPLDAYSELSAVRADILIPERHVLKLNDNTGLHPAMSAIHNLYKDGMVKIVQSIGISEPVFSHAAATNIWLNAFGTNAGNINTATPVTEQLSQIAKQIAKGSSHKTYLVTLDGFDTHVQQADKHAYLLKQLSDATANFMQACKRLHIDDKVTLTAFSEFGRRIKSNSYAGTDHGAAQPVFVIGKHVKGGIIGGNPVLAQPGYNIPAQFDCRDILTII